MCLVQGRAEKWKKEKGGEEKRAKVLINEEEPQDPVKLYSPVIHRGCQASYDAWFL